MIIYAVYMGFTLLSGILLKGLYFRPFIIFFKLNIKQIRLLTKYKRGDNLSHKTLNTV